MMLFKNVLIFLYTFRIPVDTKFSTCIQTRVYLSRGKYGRTEKRTHSLLVDLHHIAPVRRSHPDLNLVLRSRAGTLVLYLGRFPDTGPGVHTLEYVNLAGVLKVKR